MKRLRIALVTALAAASLGIGAPPASACPPDDSMACPPCGHEKIDGIWEKLTGRPLFSCWH